MKTHELLTKDYKPYNPYNKETTKTFSTFDCVLLSCSIAMLGSIAGFVIVTLLLG